MAYLQEERKHLLPLPALPFPACRNRFVRADKTLITKYNGAVYSVPAVYAEKSLLLRAFWKRIEIKDRERIIAVHDRKSRAGAP